MTSWQMIKPPFHNPFGALAGLRGSQPAPPAPAKAPAPAVGASTRSEDVCARRCSHGAQWARRQGSHGRRATGDESGGARGLAQGPQGGARVWRHRSKVTSFVLQGNHRKRLPGLLTSSRREESHCRLSRPASSCRSALREACMRCRSLPSSAIRSSMSCTARQPLAERLLARASSARALGAARRRGRKTTNRRPPSSTTRSRLHADGRQRRGHATSR